MKYLTFAVVVSLSLIMFACSSVTFKQDFDPEYDFATFKTYRWATEKEISPNNELKKYPLVYKCVKAAADKVLAEKGMTKVEGDDSDIVVLAHAASKERVQVTQTGSSYHSGWYDPWWGPYGGQTHVSYYEEATLVIDIVNWENKELAWRGMATGTVKENQNAEEQQDRLDKILVQMFKDYPPKK